MRLVALTLILAFLASWAVAADPPPLAGDAPQPELQVDSSEACRRGAMVVVAGEGPRASEDDAYLQAMSPPPADDDMWYVTVFGSAKDAASTRLIKDLSTYPELAVFVAAPEQGHAWAHFNVYAVEDETQRHRIAKYKFSGTPTLVIQPPRNGSWGSPRTVVGQFTGYDGDAKKTAAWFRATIRAFTRKASEAGYPRLIHDASSESVPPAIGAESVGADPPFATPAPWPLTAPGGQSPGFPFPVDAPTAPQAPSLNPFSLLLGSGSYGIYILVGLKIFELFARKTPSKLDDRIVEILQSLSGGDPGPDPSPTPLVARSRRRRTRSSPRSAA